MRVNKRLWMIAGALMLLTLITSGIIAEIYAKQAAGQEFYKSADAAAAGYAFVYEHKAVIVYNTTDTANGIYRLDESKKVSGNTYPVIVPGTEIPKDTFIEFSGTNDVAYYLYLEAADNFPKDSSGELTDIRYTISQDSWKRTDDFEPRHGGKVYIYSDSGAKPHMIEPHRTAVISDIIQNNMLYVSESLKDITEPLKNSEPLMIQFYVYLVQKD